MELGLKGKTAIVTGGTAGIGRAITEMLAEEGCSVAACDIEPEEAADAFVQSVTASTGTSCIAIHADVSREEDIKEINNRVISEYGGYDILVNNAGIITTAECTKMSLSEWERVLGVNLTGVFLASKAAIAHFKERGSGGRIINMTSKSAFRGTYSGHVHYSASKMGVVGLTRTLALETAGLGICVNAIAPGIVDTAIMAEKMTVSREQYERDIPLGRVAEPREIAYAVVFLASVMGGYITGSTLDVSGGIMLR